MLTEVTNEKWDRKCNIYFNPDTFVSRTYLNPKKYNNIVKHTATKCYLSCMPSNAFRTQQSGWIHKLEGNQNSRVFSPLSRSISLVVLSRNNIYGHIRTCTDFQQCTLIVTLQYYPTGRPGCQNHDLISHSVTLS